MNTRKKFLRIFSISIVWFVAVLFLGSTAHAETDKRLALLIGNGDYKDGRLISGKNNVLAMKPVLEQIGFETTIVTDANLGKIRGELESFKARIQGASAVLFFYSGHGFQLTGESYLLPVGGSPQKDRSLPLQEVLDTLARASGAVKLMILDACRSKAGIEGSQQGWAKPQATPEGVVQAFATLSGLDASSGEAGTLSPYTKALIGRFRQPGVNLKQFFTDVRNDVIGNPNSGENPQYPTTEGLDGVKDKFLLSPAAAVEARVEVADDDLIVLLNGELALNHQTQEALPKEEFRKNLKLKSGENSLIVLVSNQRTLRHGLAWERTNGWGYALRLIGPDGHELTSPECGGQNPCFSGGEEVPFKDGPHHGKTFVVATATLLVDSNSGMSPKVSLQDVKTDLWKNSEISSNIPFWAKDQKLLYAASLTKLPLGVAVAGNLQEVFDLIVKDVLEVRVKIPDPNKIYNVVRGNAALEEFVAPCIEGPNYCDERMKDFKQGLDAARNGEPKPFDGFVERLTECIRERAAQKPGFTIPREDIRVWTAFEDWTSEPNQPPNQGFSGGQSCRLGPSSAESQDALLQTPAHGLRIGPHPFTATVQEVPLALRVSAFLNPKKENDQLRLASRVVVDLADLQRKIDAIVHTVPLPTDNCRQQGIDKINPVARTWGEELSSDGEVAMLKLNGQVAGWMCGSAFRRKGKARLFSQSFVAKFPLRLRVSGPQEIAVDLGRPDIDLEGGLSKITKEVLKLLGVDIQHHVKEAVERAIKPDMLKTPLPTELQRLDSTVTGARFFNNSGALAASLDMTAVLATNDLLKLLKPALKDSP